MAYQPIELKNTIALDYDANDNIIYKGEANAGSAKSAAAWKISKYSYDVDGNLTDIQWADGNLQEDNVWDNRASLSYS